MRQLQVSIPTKFREEAQDILEDYSSDVSSSEGEKNDKKVVEFTVTAESNQIDELTEKLKDIEDLESGELSIRVLEQETLIEKGQETRGSTSMLSQEEIYSKAQEFSRFDVAQWGLICLSSAIAAYGLALDNLIVVIGAMMLAPMLSPFVSGALSIVVGDRTLMLESLRSGLEGVVLAIVVSFLSVLFFPVNITHALDLVVSPGILPILLSLLVGIAAALTFVTGLRDQVAGVAVAIALVPPLASVGIGLRMRDLVFASQAASVAFINILSIIVAGFVTFKIIGLKPSTYYKQKEAEQIRYLLPIAVSILLLLSLPVVYASYNNLDGFLAQQRMEQEAEEFFGESLLEMEFQNSRARVLVVGEFNETEFKSRLPGTLDIEVIELARTG